MERVKDKVVDLEKFMDEHESPRATDGAMNGTQGGKP